MRLQKLFANPTLLVLLTGLSCLLIGLLYIPVFPWYILGDVKEAEIGTWGICSVTGGALCTAGAALLVMASPALFHATPPYPYNSLESTKTIWGCTFGTQMTRTRRFLEKPVQANAACPFPRRNRFCLAKN